MKKFTRTIEDFCCEHCGHKVEGDGYTNHCPFCLWSKHVDVNPGDRQNNCKGLMEPVKVFYEKGNWFVMQKCEKCLKVKKIKLKEGDDLSAIESILKQEIY